MRLPILFLRCAASLLIGLSTAVTLLTNRDASSPAVVGFPIQKQSVSIPKSGLNRGGASRNLARVVVNYGIENRVNLSFKIEKHGKKQIYMKSR